MTDSLAELICHSSQHSTYHYFTNPSAPPSINNAADGELSTQNCIKPLSAPGLLDKYDGFLVACYSDHPLVSWLEQQLASHKNKHVTGIFEASVWKSLKSIHSTAAFGIVSTGKVWEDLLTAAVTKYFRRAEGNQDVPSMLFAGVETTGLNATDLHDAPAEEVRERMKDATRRLVSRPDRDVEAICLGCAGMAGMDVIVREALVEQLGSKRGNDVVIVDGVKAGVEWLEEVLR